MLTTTNWKQLTHVGSLTKDNFLIPIETLRWGQELIEAVDGKQVVFLHGPWQSGKTSALKFLQCRSQTWGQEVHYIDMSVSQPALEHYATLGYSFFNFLAVQLFKINPDSVPVMISAPDFCDWVESKNQSSHLTIAALNMIMVKSVDLILPHKLRVNYNKRIIFRK